MYTSFGEFTKKEVIESEMKTEFEHEEDEIYINFEAVNDLVNPISRGGGENRPPYVFFVFSQKIFRLTLLENL